MNKGKQELTDDELDAVNGGVGSNIEAVSYSVLNAAAGAAGENMQAIMGPTKAIDNAKQMLRPQLTGKP
jgi:bacteriocin-like protein